MGVLLFSFSLPLDITLIESDIETFGLWPRSEFTGVFVLIQLGAATGDGLSPW